VHRVYVSVAVYVGKVQNKVFNVMCVFRRYAPFHPLGGRVGEWCSVLVAGLFYISKQGSNCQPFSSQRWPACTGNHAVVVPQCCMIVLGAA
jgi:hypothetical protein